ncbi:SOUL family heme-binding protein [Falsiroseomonas oryzae]|uniref:SOUL family heme-binding protein n=1 Tax=Falsiroseomonas oryzae TaxID=2766473 RepID=UPI0022EAA1DD|nr:heme-binding protein [Roseomonas sp. MO-31]
MVHRLVALAGSLLLGACTVVGVRAGTEEPRHETLAQQAGLEIRRYAPRLAAETVVEGEEAAARSEGFSRLARYIFGANRGAARIAMTAPVAQEPLRIAMTAPVAQEATPQGHRIRFFLPAALREPPVPEDPRVTIAELPAETVAVLRFSGVPHPAAVAEARGRLLAALATTDWQPAGEPVGWFYDPPWTVPGLRRNEVAVPVAPRGA